jgi:hypothetical protein
VKKLKAGTDKAGRKAVTEDEPTKTAGEANKAAPEQQDAQTLH